MIAEQNIDAMDPAQLRELATRLLGAVKHKNALIEKLTHENAVLKRLKFAAQSERFNAEQRSLLEETLDADLQAVSEEIERLAPVATAPREREQPKRQLLPANLPRREVRHEPKNTTCICGCQMKRIGEDVAEKLDYQPGVFTVERHVRGKWACAKCEKLVQAPVAPHIIDKGIPTAGLLAQVLVAKYADHLPLYRQETIFGRAGFAIPRSTLAQWVGSAGVQLQPLVDAMRDDLLQHRILHADETPVAMLDPGAGKTHRAYLWSYCTPGWQNERLVVFDFAESRAGRTHWSFSATPVSTPGAEPSCATTTPATRRCLRRASQRPAAWPTPGANSTSCGPITRARWRSRRWRCLAGCTRVEREVADLASDDGELPADNNWVENRIRPIAIGRNNWLFAGSLRAGKRAAAIMSLVHSARLNGHDPHVYLKEVMERLPTQPAGRIGELHRWTRQSG